MARYSRVLYVLFVPFIGQQWCTTPHGMCPTCLGLNSKETKSPTSPDDDEGENEDDLQPLVSRNHGMLAVVQSKTTTETSASPRLWMPAVEAMRSGWQERQ